MEIGKAQLAEFDILGRIEHFLDRAEAIDARESKVAGLVDGAHAADTANFQHPISVLQHCPGLSRLFRPGTTLRFGRSPEEPGSINGASVLADVIGTVTLGLAGCGTSDARQASPGQATSHSVMRRDNRILGTGMGPRKVNSAPCWSSCGFSTKHSPSLNMHRSMPARLALPAELVLESTRTRWRVGKPTG